MKHHTLVIWQNIPEETKLYLIPDDKISPEQRKLLEEANGKIINCDPDCEGLDFVNAAFTEDEEYSEDLPFANNAGCFASYETSSNYIKDVLITSVCVTGFLM
jgi:hypothetical protein